MKDSDKQKLSSKVPQKMKMFEFRIYMRRMMMWFLVLLIMVPFLVSLWGGGDKNQEIPLSQVIADIKDEKVEKVEVVGTTLNVVYFDREEAVKSRIEDGQSLVKILQDAGVDVSKVEIEVADQSLSRIWGEILVTVLPLGLMVVMLLFYLRQARGAQDGILEFGRSRAKLFIKGKQNVRFADVGGMDEAKKELEEIVDFLKHPKKYTAMGARTPKGALLVGPSGTGKTLLARAVAGEAGVPFFSVAGSEFMEMLVGVGAARVRDLFGQAKKAAPAIIFVDEIESIGRMRGLGFSGGHDEREQTLNQILVEMDGFTPNDNVMVMTATNRPDLLDPALTRPGRFDRRVTLDLPDIEGRKAIIQIHKKGKPFSKDVDDERIARRTVGFSGADLANMLNEAAILAARGAKKEIDNIDMEEAATKVKLGPQRKRMQSIEERKMTAYHEAGHAIVAHIMPHVDPVHRISIVARGLTGGHTLVPPSVDRYTETKRRLLEQIATLLGGRAAEDMVFGEFTTGASSDLEIASTIAREMVTQFGMSDLGPTIFSPRPQFGIWPAFGSEGTQVSPELAAKIDREIAKFIDEGYKKAKETLSKNRAKLDKVADTLLEKETLDRDEFEQLVGKPVSVDGETKPKSVSKTVSIRKSPKVAQA